MIGAGTLASIRPPAPPVHGALAFEPVGNATKMRWEWNVHPKGAANLIRPLVGVIGPRSERLCWQGLKRYLEAHEPTR